MTGLLSYRRGPDIRFAIRPPSWSDSCKLSHGKKKVNIQEAMTHLSHYIDRVEEGEVIVVCRHNQPVAELRAAQTALARPARAAGLLRGKIHWDTDAE